jgi:uncharacterized membrane protein
MNNVVPVEDQVSSDPRSLETLKNITGTVYLCQILAFVLAGLPLVVGVLINLLKRKDVGGTWLESHFTWQINTAWIAFLLFAIAGFTLSLGVGTIVLVFAVLLLGYRVAVGWSALNSNRPIQEWFNLLS